MIPTKRSDEGPQGGKGQSEDKPEEVGEVQTPEVEPEHKEDDMEEKEGGTGRDELT